MENQDLDTEQFQLLAPVTSPDKVACVGMNYKDHCEEQGAPIPVEPLFFSKFPSCIIGPFDSIPYPDLTTVCSILVIKRSCNLWLIATSSYQLPPKPPNKNPGARLGSRIGCGHRQKRQEHSSLIGQRLHFWLHGSSRRDGS